MFVSDLIYDLEYIRKNYGEVDIVFGYACTEGDSVEAVEFVEGVAVIE